MRTYGTLRLVRNGGFWELADVEPHVSIRLKQVFPRLGVAAIPPYYLPRSEAMDADLDWFFTRYPLQTTDLERDILHQGRLMFERTQRNIESILKPDYKVNPILGLQAGQQIRPYQTQAIEMLRLRGDLLLGDEGGLGKTYTAAGFLCAEEKALPAAVVCDAHMQRQWQQKVETFTTLKCHLIRHGSPLARDGAPRNLPDADVYIWRISLVHGWADFFAMGGMKSAIYDEPQSLRNGTATDKGKACRVLTDNVLYRLGLTATPIYNYGDEMWRISEFIRPGVLGSFEEFTREWCTFDGNHWHVKDPKALGTYLREIHFMLRRLKADVGQELPKVSKIVEHVDYDEKEMHSIEELAQTLAIRATTGHVLDRGRATRELDLLARQATGVAKAEAVAKFVTLLCEAGEKVIVWGWHRQVYRIWLDQFEKAGLKPVMYTGSESIPQKEANKKAFIEGDANPLIMSLRSGQGADGLQFACSTGVAGELDWSPQVHQQNLWRIDRDGQTNPVTMFYLVTDDGSDPPMMEVLGIKQSEATGILDPHLGIQVVDAGSDVSAMKRLVQHYLKTRKERDQAA